MLSYWNGCAVTRYKTPTMLIASHIKPWRDSDNQERLDTFNGLLLTPNLDKAFDNGFISFDATGNILISEVLEKPGLLGIGKKIKIKFEPAHLNYMEFHRNLVYLNF